MYICSHKLNITLSEKQGVEPIIRPHLGSNAFTHHPHFYRHATPSGVGDCGVGFIHPQVASQPTVTNLQPLRGFSKTFISPNLAQNNNKPFIIYK